jgi:signal transduction histidine kinase/CheY-like chemotaxis protein
MNRLENRSQNGRRGACLDSESETLAVRLQWIQSVCEQLGDGYLVFSAWQCVGMGGRFWREANSGALLRAEDEDWLQVFHERDHGKVALGLADPAVNTFPPVEVLNRRNGQFIPCRLRVFHPPFDELEGVFVLVAQSLAGEGEIRAPAPGLTPTEARGDVFDVTGAEMLVIERGTGRVKAANAAFLRQNRIDREQVEGRFLAELPFLDEEVAGVILGSLELDGRMQRRPLVLNPRGGTAREMLLDAETMPSPARDWVLHFVDVTLHNCATRHLSSLLNHLPVGIFTKDPESGAYLLSNAAADAFLTDRETLRGRHDSELFPPEVGEEFAWADACVVKEGRSVETPEVRFELPGRKPRLFHILRVPVKDSRGQITRILGLVRDVTTEVKNRESLRRAKEYADRANLAKDEFLMNMGHEIRTPMNAILGFVSLLGDTGLDDEQQDLLGEVRKSGETLGAIIEEILDLSQIAGGALVIEPLDFDLEGLFEELVESSLESAVEAGLEMRLVFDPGAPARVRGDPLRIRQMLGHLVDNAVKFTPRGFVEVRLDALEVGPRYARLRIAVEDSGIGIPLAKQEEIFEPFVQADSSETRVYQGTGLGLTLSQRLAEAMGARVVVESKEGVGSRFSVELMLEHDGGGTLAMLEPYPGGREVILFTAEAERAQRLAGPLAAWGAPVRPVSTAEALRGELEAPDFDGIVLLEWDALPPDLAEAVVTLVSPWRARAHWMLASVDGEAGKRALARLGGGRLVDSILRFSALRAALVEACLEPLKGSEGEASLEVSSGSTATSLAEAASETGAFAGLGVLILDDNGPHRRRLVQLLREGGAEVDLCESEYDALECLRLHAYDFLLFETHFLGDETSRMLEELRRACRNSRMPEMIGLAYLRSDRREAELRATGVRAFLSKPINEEALQACLGYEPEWSPSA